MVDATSLRPGSESGPACDQGVTTNGALGVCGVCGLRVCGLRVCGQSLVRQGQARVSLGPSGPRRFLQLQGITLHSRRGLPEGSARHSCSFNAELRMGLGMAVGTGGWIRLRVMPRGRAGLEHADPASGIHGPGGPQCLGPLRRGCPGSVGCWTNLATFIPLLWELRGPRGPGRLPPDGQVHAAAEGHDQARLGRAARWPGLRWEDRTAPVRLNPL